MTLFGVLCLAGQAAQPTDKELEKQIQEQERQHFVRVARTGDSEAREQAYFYFIHFIRSGDSAAEVTQKLSPPWRSLETNRFMAEGLFPQWIPWTNRELVLEWRSEYRLSGGWPLIVFALFSDAQKTNLVDALLYSGGTHVAPLVDGPYNRKVLEIRAGDNMGMIFKELGRHDCDYFRDKDGKWRVRALYRTCEGHFIFYEADAGTGVILRVWDGTI